MNTLRVRNLAQKVLFESELQGQFSDGFWENATPHDHWREWCNDLRVVVDPKNVGRSWVPTLKDNYALNSDKLLSVVGDRMLEEVQRVVPGYHYNKMLEDLRDLKKIMKKVCDNAMPVPTQPFVPPAPVEVTIEATATPGDVLISAEDWAVVQDVVNNLRELANHAGASARDMKAQLDRLREVQLSELEVG